MKLTELEPRWIHEHVFVFLCPCCRKDWLSCKTVQMSHKTQRLLFDAVFGEGGWNVTHVLTKDDTAWKVSSRDFNTMTVTPSLDASASGNWHGFITAGEIK
jgi:hypothetical protein